MARNGTSFKKELAKAKRAQSQRRRKNLNTLPKYSTSTFGNASINLSAKWMWGGASSGGHFRGGYADERIGYRNAWGQYMALPEKARNALYELSVETAAKIKSDAPKGRSTQNKIPSHRNNPPGRLKRAIGSTRTDEGGAVVIDDELAPHWKYVMQGTRPHWISGPNGVTFYGWQNLKKKGKKGPVKVPGVWHPGAAPNDFVTKHYHWARNQAFDRVLQAENAARRVVPSAGKKPL